MSIKTHPNYGIWRTIRWICRTEKEPNYSLYKLKGVSVCPEWEDFHRFLKDVGIRPGPQYTLKRIDVNGPFSPDNCRWIDGKSSTNIVERILLDLVICEPATMATGCWEYAGERDHHGYGLIKVGKRSRAHIVVYEHFCGPVQKGLKLHHICRNPPCCNFEHLLPLSQKDHLRLHSDERTHCKYGHPLTGDNVSYRTGKYEKRCRECLRRRARETYQRKHGIAL
jgi:HNH endonuclease